jgi:hypothetical protein
MREMKSRRMRWVGHVAHTEKINAHKVLVDKPEGKKPLERPRSRREDIKMDVKGTRWKGMDRCKVAQGRTQR